MEKRFLTLIFVIQLLIFGYIVRDVIGQGCQNDCYNYCNDVKSSILDIRDQLNQFELE